MSDSKARYDVYKPLASGKWVYLFSTESVKKEGGAIEMLEDFITTGPDARVAVVYDTKRNAHVMIFRMNIKDRTVFQALPGGWRAGDNDILANTTAGEMKQLAAGINEELAVQEKVTAPVPTPVITDDDVQDYKREQRAAKCDYPDQPDFVILFWIHGYSNTQYLIHRPTEKQMRALTLAHRAFLNGNATPKQEAALIRINCALANNPEHCTMLVEKEPPLAKWVSIWKDCKVETADPIRVEDTCVEFIYCGFLE